MLKKLFIIPLTLGRLLAQSDSASMNEVVITGTMRPVLRQNSPVPVAVLQRSFFRSNPGAHLFESVQMVNGLQPQVNPPVEPQVSHFWCFVQEDLLVALMQIFLRQ